MRKTTLIGGIAALALVPTFAFAQQTCEQQRDNRVAGTVGGAVVGALLGSAVAGHHDRGTGAVVGAVGGGIIGNQLTKPKTDCAHAYGYYDHDGYWHSTGVSASDATGYYDRDGNWVQGAPNGYYDRTSGRWMAADDRSRGYWDAKGRWVPGAVDGFYDSNGQWVTNDRARAMADTPPPPRDYASNDARRSDSYGAYDRNGDWHAGDAARGSAAGYYDRDGRWIAGPPPMGGYGSDGRWDPNARAAAAYSADTSYNDPSYGHAPFQWTGAPGEIRQREDWLDQRIRTNQASGRITSDDASQSLRTLARIRTQERTLKRRHGGLTDADRAVIQSKLDDLSSDLREARHSNGN